MKDDTKMLDLTPTRRGRKLLLIEMQKVIGKKKPDSKVGMGLESRIQFMIYKV